MKLSVVTFNLGDTALTASIVAQLFPAKDSDVYFLTLQECNQEEQKVDIQNLVLTHLNEIAGGTQFGCVAKAQCTNLIHGFLFARESVLITKVETHVCCPKNHESSVTKGGICFSVESSGVPFTFVGGHFPAHAHQLSERNRFFDVFTEEFGAGQSGLTVWAGDLNYRVTLSYEEAVASAKAADYTKLFEHDQLHQCILEGSAFAHYKEATIQFKPTYKYVVGQREEYETKPQRVPSFTDRVLWNLQGEGLPEPVVESYQALDHIVCSDHSPVRLELAFNLR